MSEEKPTAWAHLPNAAHIDRVLAHVNVNRKKWNATWAAARAAARAAAQGAAWDAVRDAARGAARDATRDAAWDAAWDAVSALIVWDEAWGAARAAAWDAVSALIAWDEAGELLSQPPEVVKFFADEGVHAAVLLYPAVLAMQEDNDSGGKLTM